MSASLNDVKSWLALFTYLQQCFVLFFSSVSEIHKTATVRMIKSSIRKLGFSTVWSSHGSGSEWWSGQMFNASVLTKSQDSEIITFRDDAKQLIYTLPTYFHHFYLPRSSFSFFWNMLQKKKKKRTLKVDWKMQSNTREIKWNKTTALTLPENKELKHWLDGLPRDVTVQINYAFASALQQDNKVLVMFMHHDSKTWNK